MSLGRRSKVFDLGSATSLAVLTGLLLLLQRVQAFDALNRGGGNQLAQLMTVWAVLAVLIGRVQFRVMADVSEISNSDVWTRVRPERALTRGTPLEQCLIAVSIALSPLAWYWPGRLVPVVLATASYCLSTPILLSRVGSAYGLGKARFAQLLIFFNVLVQFIAVNIALLTPSISPTQVACATSLAQGITATLVLTVPVDQIVGHWHTYLWPVKQFLAGSGLLGAAWILCQADVLAALIVSGTSDYAALPQSLYLGKTGLYAVLPIAPLLARATRCGQLRSQKGLTLIVILGAPVASMLIFLTISLLDQEGILNIDLASWPKLALISLSQALFAITMVYSYRLAMLAVVPVFVFTIPILASLIIVLSADPLQNATSAHLFLAVSFIGSAVLALTKISRKLNA